jgi:hypothetical protein
VKFDITHFHENLSRKSKFGYNHAKTSGTLHKDLSTVDLLPAIAAKALSSTEMVSGR